MKVSRLFLGGIGFFLFCLVVCISIPAFGADPSSASATTSPTKVPASTPAATPVLPDEFAGWRIKGSIDTSSDPAGADAVNAPVLKEYGFQSLEKATYVRDDGRNLVIKAAVFDDASGAYGAFTFYASPDMGVETIGGQAAFLNNRVLFYQGNVLVDAMFDRMSVMSASQLRQLAGLIPQVEGGRGKPPLLPTYLPKLSSEKNFEPNTTKYVLGPIALDRIGSPLTSSMVNFEAGAEVVLAKYAAAAGDATLMLIEYPTPQIAAERLRQIDASHHIVQQRPGVASIVDVGPFFDARTGPIIVIAAGPLSIKEARSLMASINYDVDVTWNENTYVRKKDNLANFLFNAIILCGIVVGLALVAGIAFGGIRLLIKRYFPDSMFDRREAVEFIALNLEEEAQPGPVER